MDDNISKLFGHAKEKDFEHWRAKLPSFKFKDGRARRVWDEYLVGCTDPHKRKVASFVAIWANRLDKQCVLSGHAYFGEEGEIVRTGYWDGKEIDRARREAVETGHTTSKIFLEAVKLMEDTSVWSEYVTRWAVRNKDLL